MKKIILLTIISISFVFSSYSVGQTISISDQQLTREVCYSSDFDSEYSIGDDFSLYDLNGQYNGGEYHVVFVDMSATW
jgi:hypothetical protein